MILDESPDAAVVAGLAILGKEAARDFPVPAVVRHALAARALARTGLIGAGAGDFVFIYSAFHNDLSSGHESGRYISNLDDRTIYCVYIAQIQDVGDVGKEHEAFLVEETFLEIFCGN